MEFIKVILSLRNPFDYSEYTLAHIGTNVNVVSIGSYAQVVGMLKVAMVQYPDIIPEEAYMQFIDDMNNAVTSTPEQQIKKQSAKAGCPGCGGGKVI